MAQDTPIDEWIQALLDVATPIIGLGGVWLGWILNARTTRDVSEREAEQRQADQQRERTARAYDELLTTLNGAVYLNAIGDIDKSNELLEKVPDKAASARLHGSSKVFDLHRSVLILLRDHARQERSHLLTAQRERFDRVSVEITDAMNLLADAMKDDLERKWPQATDVATRD